MESYEIEHLEQLRQNAGECTVLLRSNGTFPLKAPGLLALYGNGARYTRIGGTGSGEVNCRNRISIEQALAEAGFVLTTEEWLDGYDAELCRAKKAFRRELRRRARAKLTLSVFIGMGAVMPEPDYDLPLNGDGDTAVYVLSRLCGEGSDRQAIPGDLLLTETEIRDILQLQAQYRNFLLVLNVGGMVDLSPLAAVENILLLGQLGSVTSHVLADILLGKTNPSGKLTDSWIAWDQHPALAEFGEKDDTHYYEGIYMGYRYYDAVQSKPLFPFGYGRSFTEFSFAPENFSVQNGTTFVNVQVKNCGAFAGKEVLQLYAALPQGELDQPPRRLVAFTKTELLQPGEMTTVSLKMPLNDLASFSDKSHSWVLEAGVYNFTLSNGSDEQHIGALRFTETTSLFQSEYSCGDSGFTDWKPQQITEMKDVSVQYTVSANEIPVMNQEAVDLEIAEQLERCTNRELVYLNIGGFAEGAGILSVIGDASSHVAGAAGETTSRVKGIDPLIMADGPAGLRLSAHYFQCGDQAYGMERSIPDNVYSLMPKAAKMVLRMGQKRPGKDEVIQEQFATAIPIGTAVAQSWNGAFAQLCGDVIGEEMQRFGIHLWLAPALNLHRDPRCGRNFEYFSEDPLLSGKIAAAMTKGVQQHAGCGVVLKHFAANNQETSRYTNNSLVSERAMRELYLRGFSIAIADCAPAAVMTSYNLLNGTHTSEHRELLEILRKEMGFDGLIMTDWMVTNMMDRKGKHPIACIENTLSAGTNLYMPGNQKEYERLCKALYTGKISRNQLMKNAAYVLKTTNRLFLNNKLVHV